MKKFIFSFALLVVLVSATLLHTSNLLAAGPQWVVVNAGDTLYSIAARYGTTVAALLESNKLPNANFVYSGQRLLIPSGEPQANPPAAANATAPQSETSVVYYTVRPGDTLAGIAANFQVPLASIISANGLTNLNFVWYGQRLIIPGAKSINGINQPPAQVAVSAQPQNSEATNPLSPGIAANPPTDGKWIDVNVTKQTITAYEGANPLKTILVSTGTVYHPTVIGTFHIQSKYAAVDMVGGTPGIDYYDLPNVPWTMFFYQGYAIHGTYWHHNFGHPMSHGCVNLPTDEAKWFYDWAPIGTTVVTHA